MSKAQIFSKFSLLGCGLLLGSFLIGGAYFSPAVVPTMNTETVIANTDNSRQSCDDINDPASCEGVRFLETIINLLAFLVVPIITIVIIVGGIQYMTAGDNPERVAAARGRIIKAIVALLSFVSMWAFLSWLIPGGLF